MIEKWSSIIGCNGYYEVSNKGRVRSYKKGGFNRRKFPRILKFGDSRGYNFVFFHFNNRQYPRRVARLVATYFVPNPYNKPQVNHIDGIKRNDCYSNLEWVTNKENQQHAIKYLNRNASMQRGEKHANSKLKNNQVIEIKELLNTGNFTHKELGKRYNVSPRCIGDINTSRTWKEI